MGFPVGGASKNYPPRQRVGGRCGESPPHAGEGAWRGGQCAHAKCDRPCAPHFPDRPGVPIFPGMDAPPFGLTDRAATRIAEIASAEAAPGAPPAALRIAVLAGGCSGLQYRFDLDRAPQPDDLVIARGAATVLVDPVSLDLLAGSELDYTDALMGSHFAVRNPNAKSACGCGTSFSID